MVDADLEVEAASRVHHDPLDVELRRERSKRREARKLDRLVHLRHLSTSTELSRVVRHFIILAIKIHLVRVHPLTVRKADPTPS